MYLLDTNIILELLLEQEKAEDVAKLFTTIPHNHLYLSKFTLYSLGVILLRRKKHELFLKIVDDLLVNGGLQTVQLKPENMADLVATSQKFNLDFDDAYQYTVAEIFDLVIVSFDSDFDRTAKARKTPAAILRDSAKDT